MAEPIALSLDNFDQGNIVERSYIDADVAATATQITIRGVQGVVQNSMALIGGMGQELTEIRSVDAIAGSIITVVALKNDHKENEPITFLAADQLQVWRGAAPSDGSQPDYADMAKYGDPFDIDYDNMSTMYVDNTGGSDYWYGYTYVNSKTAYESSITSSRLVRGGSAHTYCSLQEILEDASLQNNSYISSKIVAEKRQSAQALIDGRLGGYYAVPFSDPIPDRIVGLAKRLASGLLLMSFSLTYDEGKKKYADAIAELDAIQSKTENVQDQTGASLAIENVGGFSMYPDADSESLTAEQGGRKFTSDIRY